MYPTSLGAEHMRSLVKLPEHIRLYPQYLRDAGYYCTNNSKEDYNVQPNGQVWDESSKNAHWKNRPAGQPFFAIFNHTITHESQIRNAIDDADRIHDPAKVRVPAYHPDCPEVRKDWAQYYDRITMMDKLVAQNLQELEDAGLAEDTIVFFYGDHGSGMPRNKRFPGNSGLHVPLLIHVPEKWQHLATADCVMGGTSDRLVSFVDFAPTLLSLCGVPVPEHMQGVAFLGSQAGEPRTHLFGFRGRMDERIDMQRSVTDGRYVYVRNFMPHLPHGQHVDYMFQTPTTRVWYEKFLNGELNEAQSQFWKEKPAEELYDLQSDPDEVVNLVSQPGDHPDVETLRMAIIQQMHATRDLGFLAESEIHRLANGKAPYELGIGLAERTVTVESKRPKEMSVVLYGCSVASQMPADFGDHNVVAPLTRAGRREPGDTTSMIRYWAVMAAMASRGHMFEDYRVILRGFLNDPAPAVKVIAAEVLGLYGNADDLALALPVLLEHANAETHGVYNAVHALNAIDHLGERADSIRAQVAKLPRKDPNAPPRVGEYCNRLIEHITAAPLQ